jgi:hypothetical protein
MLYGVWLIWNLLSNRKWTRYLENEMSEISTRFTENSNEIIIFQLLGTQVRWKKDGTGSAYDYTLRIMGQYTSHL